MPNKPIIDIQVNDEQFKAFYEHYKGFHEQLETLPDEWKNVGSSAIGAADGMAEAGRTLLGNAQEAIKQNKTLVDALEDARKAQRQFGLEVGSSGSALAKMAKDAKELKDTLFGVGSFLMKLGALGVGALVGGFFGMDKLAEAATSGQRQARGLGMTTGQLNAFKVDFGRYADDSTLQSVADARSDLTKTAWMSHALGISSDRINNMELGDLTGQLMLKAHDWWANSPSNQRNQTYYNAQGFDQAGISFDMARQLGNTPRGELTDALGRYDADRSKFGFSDASTDKLYKFQRELEAAGTMLQSHLIDKLGDLGVPLANFTQSLEKDAEILIDSLLTPGNIQKIGDELNHLATYLASDDFKQSAQDFITDMKNLSGAVFELAKFIAHLLPSQYQLPDDQQIDPNSKEAAYSTDDLKNNPYNYSKEMHNGWFSNWSSPQFQGPYYSFLNPLNPSYAKYEKQLKDLQDQFGVPADFLRAQEFAESSGVQYAISRTGSRGPFQFTSATAKQYGVDDPFDFFQASTGAAKLDADLKKMFGGDLHKVAAAYGELGPVGVQKLVSQYGANWEAHAPAKDRAYITRVLKEFQAASKPAAKDDQASLLGSGQSGSLLPSVRNGVARVDVRVFNQSGSNLNISTNASAAG